MHSLALNHRLNGKPVSQLSLCSFYSHRWSELLPPFFHRRRRNACKGKDERKICCCPPCFFLLHPVLRQTVGLFPVLGSLLTLKNAIQVFKQQNKPQIIHTGREFCQSWQPVCRSYHKHRAVLASFLPPSLFPSLLPDWNLSRALLLAEWPGHVIKGLKPQTWNLCLQDSSGCQRREEKRRKCLSSGNQGEIKSCYCHCNTNRLEKEYNMNWMFSPLAS